MAGDPGGNEGDPLSFRLLDKHSGSDALGIVPEETDGAADQCYLFSDSADLCCPSLHEA